ncbi:MAG: SOS response-associated peptidase, partial [Polyangiaceae bacterium]|nr:SOS response-associated peptidase [Polyangiaceae bacterium]
MASRAGQNEHDSPRRPTLVGMCGRTALTASPDELREVFDLDGTPEVEPHHNVPPSAVVHAVRVLSGRKGRHLDALRWGLVPHWATDPKIGHRLALARVESVVTAPAFRQAIRRRRCLVAVDAFYEWRRDGSRSQPFLFRRADGKPFARAAVWERWTSADGEVIESCAIITQPARPPADAIHDRMPLVLDAGAWAAWLDPHIVSPDAIAPLVAPRAPDLVTFPVTPRVNDPRYDRPDCFAP